jgi:ribosomal protein L3 glutamine methyltransferase
MRSAERRVRRAPASPTLETLLRDAVRRFDAARLSYGHGTTNARDEAAWLILHSLALPLDELESHLTRPIDAQSQRRIEMLVAKRIHTRKPAAYLLREAWLGAHRFYVDERALVPRSYLAELLREGLKPWLRPRQPVRRALDLGTGSGCIAILLALEFRRAQVDAVDISSEALDVARINVSDYRLAARIELIESDLYAGLARRHYDLIVSNPPYVREAVMRGLPREYQREPRPALAGGRDGLTFVKRIVADAPAYLNPRGLLVVEVGHNRRRVERAFPQLPLMWPETSGGDDCVFVITREALLGPVPDRAPRRAIRAGASPRPRAAT